MLKRKLYKKWTFFFLSIFIFVTASVVAINYAVDPMWCFNHETPFAEWREFIDERIQKANLLRFRKDEIDTLIIGSSRVMQMDTNKIGDGAFNFGLSSCMPIEYSVLMEIFHETRGYYPDKIIVGLDFFGANATYNDGSKENRAVPILQMLDDNAFIYRMEMLSSIELSRKSFNLIRKNISIKEDDIEYADIRYNVGHMGASAVYPPIEDVEHKKHIVHNLYIEFKKIYEFFRYNEQYKKNISALLQLSSQVDVKPYITPEGTLTMRIIAETPGRIDDYERMLRDAVDVFGGVWNFMYVNSVTSNHIYWREPSHCLKQVNSWILDRMSGNGNPPTDFGVYVTKENIDEHIKEVRAQLLALPSQKDSWTELMGEYN